MILPIVKRSLAWYRYLMLCTLNGCGCEAMTIDPVTGFPMCWDCFDEIDAMRVTGPVSLWDVAADGFKLGLFAGVFYGLGHGW